jgi:2-polyprenyl-3-methyl-5-hydroxy-6-metoxy-1,4-benzoquinol methylase
MKTITDDNGFNQVYSPSETMRVRSERRCDMLLSAMKIDNETNILEIGCGTGEIAEFIARKTKAKVTGIDICKPFIEEAKKRNSLSNLQFEVLNFNETDSLPEEKFDYVIGNGILHHLYLDLDNALLNINLLLKEDGKLIFLEPNLVNPYCYLIFTYPFFRKKAKLDPDEMAFTKSYILKKLEKNRYTNNTVKYKDFLLPVTPKFLINSLIWIGNILERTPFLMMMSQSILITGTRAHSFEK